jgi:EAL and modified HD-GYP domain-containing signal transduction protein
MPPVNRSPVRHAARKAADNPAEPPKAAAKTVAKASASVLREPESVYLGRQPIIGRNGALHAYELLFRDSPDNRARIFDDVQATAHVVARTVGEIGLSAVLGDHRGYVNMNRELLFDDIVHIMPPERFVLEILETVTFDARLFKRCGQLRAAGFQFALDDVVALTEPLYEALPYVDYVKVDFLATESAHLPELAATLKQHGKTLIAEKIETHQDFDAARELGFELFQGYFFARPQVLVTRRSNPSRTALLRLLGVLSGEPRIDELEAELKLNPNVVVQLLRLANSSAFQLIRPVSSLREAIAATGTRQISRWTQLLLYADGRHLPWRSDPLVQLVGTRARFMELAARVMRPLSEKFADAAFMTGIFSLVHVVVDLPPAEIMDLLKLSKEIGAAIVDGQGPLGTLLRLSQAAERGDAPELDSSIGSNAEFKVLTPAVLADLQFQAATWFGAHRVE